MLIALHGYGDNYQHFKSLFAQQNEMIVVVPEAPYAFALGRKTGYSWTSQPKPLLSQLDESNKNDSFKMDSGNVRKIIEYMKTNYNITSVYLLGFSQGAVLAYISGILNYDLVDGIAVFGGWLDEDIFTKTQLKLAKKLKVYIAHGNSDPVVDPKSADAAAARLQDFDYKIKVDKFEGGHQVPIDVQKSALEWLKADE